MSSATKMMFAAGGAPSGGLPPENGVRVSNIFSGYTNSGQTILASSESSVNFPAWEAFDGSEDTGATGSKWQANGLPAWLQIDFGAPQAVYSIRTWIYDNYSTSWKVESSDDGVSWVTRHVGVGTLFTGIYALDTPAVARYWRIYSITGNSGWRINEMAYYS